MALLDRFRTKPAWQHEDPVVRAAAVRELPGDDQERLVAIARGDADARVRRAALKKLAAPATLAEVIREDADASVREEAAAVLTGILERVEEAELEPRALEAIQDPRQLAVLASSARAAAVRRVALDRLSSPRSLAEVARAAADPEVRLLALERLSDAAAVAEIALKAEHKDVALKAVERLDREALRAVAAKAHNRSAARRAKALLAEAGEEAQPPKPAERRARRVDLARRLDGLARTVDFDALRQELAETAEAWSGLSAGAGAEDEVERRYLAARAALETRLAQHDAELEQQRRLQAEVAAARDARAALCDEAERLAGAEPEAAVAELRARFEALPPWSDPGAEALLARFRAACDEAAARQARFAAGESARARLEALCQELVEATAADDATKAGALRKEAEPLLAVATPELRERYAAADAAWREHAARAREERARAAQENLAKLQALCEQLEALAKAEQPKLRDAEAALREARERLGPAGLGPLASKKDREALTGRLKHARGALYPRVQELRTAREWARWASEGVQEELCARAEALLLETDTEKVVRAVKDLDARWGQARGAPKENAEALRERFKAAREALRARCDAHFAQQAQERGENLKRKLALCERAEALADSSDWLKTAQALVALQAEWKAVGPAPQRDAKAVWERFRGACDRFFTRRKQDLVQRKDDWGKNLEKKEALCVRAEALVESSAWEATAAELKRLQSEWKGIGPVRKSRSEAVWQRFRKACDAFFERYKKRDELGRAAQAARREALCAELEALAPAAGAEPPADLLARVQGAQAAWREGGPPGALQARFAAALDALVLAWPGSFAGSELDPEANRRKREKLCSRVEGLVASTAQAPAPVLDLAARLKEALASNTMGARREDAPRARVAEEVEAARAAWKRVGPVPGDAGRALQERFETACRRALGPAPRP